ncbi:redox-regulated ATPase YchF [Nitrosarchaeum koreense]|uniref:GTP-binding protein HSR1-related protein n=1 Tax=Nitrosarchaeum koreense MY1 TaxID=1001994 RepID=F9CY45_9ARCH|nr:redox-regulated ATPase YchF [Nitrosarchaeum koreense]EGP94400.1 GTP-binding protein HSR1-related protein [Nitrosarchaeum koreense MY1]
MQIGLLGKANVGKSTFFSAATETPVPIGNFPFTTIQPNVGVAYVKSDCACKHFEIKHQNPLCVNGTRFIPIKLIDVAGLVPGAHEGKGLGNQFLDDARQAEVLIHVVDIAGTTDIQGQPVPIGTHDPIEDVNFVENEFDQWFTDILRREWDKLTREIEQKRAKLTDGIAKRFTGLGIKDYQIQDVLHKLELSSKNPKEWNDSDIQTFVKELRKNTKPFIIAANKADLCKDLDIIKKIPDTIVVPCSAETELLLRKASKSGMIHYESGDEKFSIVENKEILPQQQKALDLVNNVFTKIHSTGIQKILNLAVFDLLKLIVVFPVEDETKLTNKNGDVLPDAKLLPYDSTAKDLAGLIHADIAKGFLHAIDCKTKQRIGGDHKLKNGDVIKIVSTLSRG